MRERIKLSEAHQRMKNQGVSSHRHYAFKCPVCGTVQSMASLVKAGAPTEEVDKYIGFSCEGRFSGAGAWPSSKDQSEKAATRRQVRGCNWTLGGLFQIHELEVEHDDGAIHAAFIIASAEEAQKLELELEAV